MNDLTIVDLLWKRDEQAIAELKRKYEGLCFRVAGNILSCHEDAEECVNASYYAVWDTVPPNRPKKLGAYLCRLLKNIAVSRLRYNTADKRSSDFLVSLEELAECTPDRGDVEESVSASMLGEVISRFLRAQPKKYRLVFVRRYWYSDSLADIAELYKMNENTVATYLFRTRKKLGEFLKKEGYFV